jgi:hypothetical protein
MDPSAKQPRRPEGPNLEYRQARPIIQTGDVLLFQGLTRISRFIRWGSKSAYSHAGLALWWDDRLMVVQSASRGVELLPASTAVDRYAGQVDWWQPREDIRERLDVRAMVNASFDELGKPYAVWPLVALVMRMFRGEEWGHSDEKYGTESYFCSQLVSRCYRKAGVDLMPGKADADTSPGDLSRSGMLVLRGVLHSHPEGLPVTDPLVAGPQPGSARAA